MTSTAPRNGTGTKKKGSYKTTFAFGEEGGALSYLSGKTIKLSRVPFVEKYFKGVEI